MSHDIGLWVGAGAIACVLILWAMILGYLVFGWLFGCGHEEETETPPKYAPPKRRN